MPEDLSVPHVPTTADLGTVSTGLKSSVFELLTHNFKKKKKEKNSGQLVSYKTNDKAVDNSLVPTGLVISFEVVKNPIQKPKNLH